ncbi:MULTISPECIES: hypothetical protein [Burkholderiaceae]|uniref:hypothetical protein n=1 Tax=Burkholderiaceae TaxID=119060 RepID=UPI00095C43D8|nr:MULTISPECIES: hypothetical protein [Burkholderiaceae]MCG1017843.1 hypothetical protein [Mycetohabitans sp. B4]SIT67741.1 hypothetical protein SAMN04487768_1253 [Burkholderia sp. b13]
MDLDLNAALNDYRTYVYALEVYQKPSAASMPPQQKPADVALTDLPADRPTTYNDLPPEVILRIGSHVPIQDVGSFGAVNSQTYYLMKDRRTVWRFWRRAERAVSLSAVKTIIWDLSGLIEDPEQRVEPIEMLRQRLMALPRAERVEAFQRLYSAADGIPKEGAQIQRAMMAMLGDFPIPERARLFNYLGIEVEHRSPDQENLWPELALQLRSFPLTSPKILEGYQFILAKMPGLSESQQAELIPVLADLLFQFLDKYGYANTLVSQLYAELRERMFRLSMPYQGASIGALAAVVSALPESERPVRYAEMRNVAMALPDEPWSTALHGLFLGLLALPNHRYADEMRVLERGFARVPLAQRTQVAAGLLECAFLMDDTLSRQVWQQALALLNSADEEQLYRVFEVLKRRGIILAQMSNAKRDLAISEIISYMKYNRFSEQGCTRILDNLGYGKAFARE